jgi:hypothetical protein
MEAYEQLVKLVQEAADDVAKAEGGNKAAGTRVRKAMQEIKKAAQEVRTAVLASRDGAEATPTRPTAPATRAPAPGRSPSIGSPGAAARPRPF